jgi:extracellular elastinolytic metalloproteinase
MIVILLLAVAAFAAPFTKLVSNYGPEPTTHTVQFPVTFDTLSRITQTDAERIALEYFDRDLQAFEERPSLKVTNIYKTNNVFHIYLVQIINDFEIVNAVGNVNVLDNGNMISASHSFYRSKGPLSFRNVKRINQNLLKPADALLAFLSHLGLSSKYQIINKNNNLSLAAQKSEISIPHKMKYIQTKNEIRLCYDFEVDLVENWFNSQVDAYTGETLQNIDWVSHATFNVYPWGVNDPSEGERKLLVNPEHLESSPLGWNTFKTKKGKKHSTVTAGNNVYAQGITCLILANPTGENQWKNNYRPDGGKDLKFDFPLDLKKDPTEYLNATITNLFYLNNMIHDIFYLYGFDEESGNFQENNFEKGGLGNDGVIANAQDGSGNNNGINQIIIS